MAIFREMSCGCIVVNVASDSHMYPNNERLLEDTKLWLVVKPCNGDPEGSEEDVGASMRTFTLEQIAGGAPLDSNMERKLFNELRDQLTEGIRMRQVRNLLKR